MIRRLSASFAVLAVLATAAASRADAQVVAKKPFTTATYDMWRSVQGATLSADGRWAAYTVTPQVGDGRVVVHATAASTEYSAPRGWTGRPINSVAQDSAFSAPAAQFTPASRQLVYLEYAAKAEFDRARREKRKPADQPKATLAVMSLADGSVVRVPRVRSVRVPRFGGRYFAYLMEPTDSAQSNRVGRDSARTAMPGAPAGSAAASPGGAARPVAADSVGAKKKEFGSTLVVRDAESGSETRVADVLAYTFSDSGSYIGYTVSSRDPARDGAYARSLGAAVGGEVAMMTGRGDYKLLAFDRAGRQAAFVSDHDEYAAKKPRYSVYHAPLGSAARLAVAAGSFADSAIVADRGRFEFTRDGSALLFGILAPSPDSVPADSLADKAVFDLWSYRDPRLQPQQKLEAGRDRDRAYAAVFQIATRKAVRLGNDSLPQITLSDDGRTALAVTSVPYALDAMWGDEGSDVIVIDARTGRRTPVATRVEFGATLSPGGRYVLYWADSSWRTFEVATGKRSAISAPARGVRFDQETWDTPSTPAPWGVVGWTEGDRAVIAYSQYDVWSLDPAAARAPIVLSDSAGVRGHMIFRHVDLDPTERVVHPSATLFRALDDSTKATGFYRIGLTARQAPERIVMADRAFGAPQKARNADVYLVTSGTFREFPDVYAGPSLTQLTRLSDANPQQAEYSWGSVELVRWRNDDGRALSGLLYKPEGFDRAKKYPMIVYYYESLSDNLHSYVPPAGRNIINPTVYASKGYLVFEPDIAYTTGYPGQSALKSIVPGVQRLIDSGFVDAKNVGLQGQSWGGYQTAYVVTQTNMFKAAMAGAPVANMTSAYGGIRWESGVARAFQYEAGQSRIGASLWQAPMRYIENSPLFYVDRIHTPLFIMSNDGDGAVPWYQGIEMFVALRRFNKPVWLVDYNGDAHNPRKRANQQDVDRRMQQFFDHYLMGQPAPEWMEKGIPFLQKGRDQLAAPSAAMVGAEGAVRGAPTAVAGQPQGQPQTP